MAVQHVGKYIMTNNNSKIYIDLGWANSWSDHEYPSIVRECNNKKHYNDKANYSDIDVGPKYRGLEHIVTCHICKYIYRYDSSD